MTLSDGAKTEERPQRSLLAEFLILALLVLGLIFCIGVMAGFFAAASKNGLSFKDLAIGAVLLVPAGLCGWQVTVRAARMIREPGEKIAPSVKKVRHLWTFFIATGFVLGALVTFSAVRDGQGKMPDLMSTLNSSESISPYAAAIMLACLFFTCIGTVFYYRYIDEHDRAAQESASLWAINAYFVLIMGWWTSAKGGFTGPIDHGAVFVTVLSIWIAIWLWRRYR